MDGDGDSSQPPTLFGRIAGLAAHIGTSGLVNWLFPAVLLASGLARFNALAVVSLLGFTSYVAYSRLYKTPAWYTVAFFAVFSLLATVAQVVFQILVNHGKNDDKGKLLPKSTMWIWAVCGFEPVGGALTIVRYTLPDPILAILSILLLRFILPVHKFPSHRPRYVKANRALPALSPFSLLTGLLCLGASVLWPSIITAPYLLAFSIALVLFATHVTIPVPVQSVATHVLLVYCGLHIVALSLFQLPTVDTTLGVVDTLVEALGFRILTDNHSIPTAYYAAIYSLPLLYVALATQATLARRLRTLAVGERPPAEQQSLLREPPSEMSAEFDEPDVESGRRRSDDMSSVERFMKEWSESIQFFVRNYAVVLVLFGSLLIAVVLPSLYGFGMLGVFLIGILLPKRYVTALTPLLLIVLILGTGAQFGYNVPSVAGNSEPLVCAGASFPRCRSMPYCGYCMEGQFAKTNVTKVRECLVGNWKGPQAKYLPDSLVHKKLGAFECTKWFYPNGTVDYAVKRDSLSTVGLILFKPNDRPALLGFQYGVAVVVALACRFGVFGTAKDERIARARAATAAAAAGGGGDAVDEAHVDINAPDTPADSDSNGDKEHTDTLLDRAKALAEDLQRYAGYVWEWTTSAAKFAFRTLLTQADKISLLILFVFSLSRITLMNAGYMTFFIVFFTFPVLARNLWLLLVLYAEACIVAVYTCQFLDLQPVATIELIGLYNFNARHVLLSSALAWHVIILIVAVVQLFVYGAVAGYKAEEKAREERVRADSALSGGSGGGGGAYSDDDLESVGSSIAGRVVPPLVLMTWRWATGAVQTYGLLITYTLLFCVPLFRKDVTLITLIYMFFLLVFLLLHQVMSWQTSKAWIARLWVLLVITSAAVLLAQYAFQFAPAAAYITAVLKEYPINARMLGLHTVKGVEGAFETVIERSVFLASYAAVFAMSVIQFRVFLLTAPPPPPDDLPLPGWFISLRQFVIRVFALHCGKLTLLALVFAALSAPSLEAAPYVVCLALVFIFPQLTASIALPLLVYAEVVVFAALLAQVVLRTVHITPTHLKLAYWMGWRLQPGDHYAVTVVGWDFAVIAAVLIQKSSWRLTELLTEEDKVVPLGSAEPCSLFRYPAERVSVWDLGNVAYTEAAASVTEVQRMYSGAYDDAADTGVGVGTSTASDQPTIAEMAARRAAAATSAASEHANVKAPVKYADRGDYDPMADQSGDSLTNAEHWAAFKAYTWGAWTYVVSLWNGIAGNVSYYASTIYWLRGYEISMMCITIAAFVRLDVLGILYFAFVGVMLGRRRWAVRWWRTALIVFSVLFMFQYFLSIGVPKTAECQLEDRCGIHGLCAPVGYCICDKGWVGWKCDTTDGFEHQTWAKRHNTVQVMTWLALIVPNSYIMGADFVMLLSMSLELAVIKAKKRGKKLRRKAAAQRAGATEEEAEAQAATPADDDDENEHADIDYTGSLGVMARIRLYLLLHSYQVVLAVMFILAAVETRGRGKHAEARVDLLSLGYFVFTLYALRLGKRFYPMRHKLWKYLQVYNFVVLMTQLVYQTAFLSGSVESLLFTTFGFLKLRKGDKANVALTTSGVLPDVIALAVLALQGRVFKLPDFDEAVAYAEREQANAADHAREIEEKARETRAAAREALEQAHVERVRRLDELKRKREYIRNLFTGNNGGGGGGSVLGVGVGADGRVYEVSETASEQGEARVAPTALGGPSDVVIDSDEFTVAKSRLGSDDTALSNTGSGYHSAAERMDTPVVGEASPPSDTDSVGTSAAESAHGGSSSDDEHTPPQHVNQHVDQHVNDSDAEGSEGGEGGEGGGGGGGVVGSLLTRLGHLFDFVLSLILRFPHDMPLTGEDGRTLEELLDDLKARGADLDRYNDALLDYNRREAAHERELAKKEKERKVREQQRLTAIRLRSGTYGRGTPKLIETDDHDDSDSDSNESEWVNPQPTLPPSAFGGKRLRTLAFALRVLIVQNTFWILFGLFVLDTLVYATVLSMVYPLSFLLVGLLPYPRPSKNFWEAMVMYTEIILVVKYIYQLPIFCLGDNGQRVNFALNLSKPYCELPIVDEAALLFSLPNMLGVTHLTDRYFLKGVALDFVILIMLYVHRNILEARGVWEELPPVDDDGEDESSGDKKNKLTSSTSRSSGGFLSVQRKHPMDDDEVSLSSEMSDVFFGDANELSDQSTGYKPTIQERIMHFVGSVRNFYFLVLDESDNPTTDFYAATFAVDMLSLVVFFFAWGVFTKATADSSNGVAIVSSSQIPIGFVLLLMAQFTLIVVDRVIYLNRSHKMKLVYQYVNVILIHYIWFLWLPPYKEVPFQKSAAVVFMYLIKLLSFTLGALQLKLGYPLFNRTQFLTSDSSNLILVYLYTGYMAVPFIYELRSLLDWICTSTTMSLKHWMRVEDIYNNLYEVKVRGEALKQSARQLGDPQTFMAKCTTGVTLFVALSLVLWLPLLLFSSANPTLVAHPITSATLDIYIAGYEPLYSTQITDISNVRRAMGQKAYTDLCVEYPALLQTKDYGKGNVQILTMSVNSLATWAINPNSRDSLVGVVLDCANGLDSIVLTSDLTFVRNGSVTNLGSVEETLTPAQCTEMYEALTSGNSSKAIAIPSLMPRIVHLTEAVPVLFYGTGGNSGASAELDLRMQLMQDDGEEWWTISQSGADKIPNHNSSAPKKAPQMIGYTELVPGSAFSPFAAGGVIGLYVGVVLTIGKFLRDYVYGTSFNIIYEELLPEVDNIIELVEDIYVARQGSVDDLKIEEELYNELVQLYRSPQSLIDRTKAKMD